MSHFWPLLLISGILIWAIIAGRRRRAEAESRGEFLPSGSMRFRNPSNDYVEQVSLPGLWCLLFGFFYLAYKGAWMAAVLAATLAVATLGISWLIFPFFAAGVVRRAYLQKGWIQDA